MVTINDSTQYYDRITSDIKNPNNQMTNKGIIFEDIANFLKQINSLIDNIVEMHEVTNS